MQGGLKWWAISPHKAFNKHTSKESLGLTTKHARRGEMVGHFASPSMSARRVWGDNQAYKKG